MSSQPPSLNKPSSLLLFTTSQSPLTPRYPHSAKPSLLLPSLLHTSLHNALDGDLPSWSIQNTRDGEKRLIIPNPDDLGPCSTTAATGISPVNETNGTPQELKISKKSSIANLQPSHQTFTPVSSSLDLEREKLDNEITVKFHLVGNGNVEAQKKWIQDGLEVLNKYKREKWASSSTGNGSFTPKSPSPTTTTTPIPQSLPNSTGQIDTFLLGYKSINYIGYKTPTEEEDSATKIKSCGSAKLQSKLKADREREEQDGEEQEFRKWSVGEKEKGEILELWKSLPSIIPNAKQLGTLSFPLPLLKLLSSSSSSSSSHTETQPSSMNQHPAQQSQVSSDSNTLSSMSSSDPPIEHEHKANSTDKQLMGEYVSEIGTPVITIDLKSIQEKDVAKIIEKENVGKDEGKLKVNCLNVPDCHALPKDLAGWAKEMGVELWAGGSGMGSDPLPSQHLHNTLVEFIPQFPSDLVSSSIKKLETIIPFEENEVHADDRVDGKLGVQVQWVLSYTVISRTRNVVKDKGSIISARLL